MVKAVVTIDGKTMEQTLPVMRHQRHRSDARAVSPSKGHWSSAVRCLGWHQSLPSEDLKHVVQHTDFEKAQQFIDAGDYMSLHQFVKGLSEKDQIELFNQRPNGREDQLQERPPGDHEAGRGVLELRGRGNGEAVTQSDAILLTETIDELSTYERTAVWARLNGEQQKQLNNYERNRR